MMEDDFVCVCLWFTIKLYNPFSSPFSMAVRVCISPFVYTVGGEREGGAALQVR